MREEDVTVRDGGRTVDCQLMARSIDQAFRIAEHADQNPPLGYIMLMAKIRRRAKGGRARFVTLCFRLTGNAEYPPMEDWRDWNATLEAEQRMASRVEVTQGVARSRAESPKEEPKDAGSQEERGGPRTVRSQE